jgi:phospholipid/cholesterol/gamma-HCH transport system substrate-binding protein
MSRSSRYRNSEIKAGIWILISLGIFAAFIVAVSGAKFWKELDFYHVQLDYVGGLEVGSPVRMGGMAVGKISQISIRQEDNASIGLTIEVRKGLNIKSNTVAYLSFVSITSEHHLELDPSHKPAPLLKPGDLINSKDLTTMDGMMDQMVNVGDTLKEILHRVNLLLNPTSIARIDSIIAGVNTVVQSTSGDLELLLSDTRQTVHSIDTLLGNVNQLLAGSDSMVTLVMQDARNSIQQATATLAAIDTTVYSAEKLLENNSSSLNGIIHDMERTSENLKIMSDQVKDNPFLLIRAIPKKERALN